MAGTGKTGKNNNKARSNPKSNNGQKKSKKVDNTYTTERKNAAIKALKEEEDPRQREIYLFIYLAVALFLLCSNFGWCGVVGDFISNIIFGLFGTVSYVIPIFVFFTAAFLFANGVQKKIVKRVSCAAIFLVVLAFVFQLIAGVKDVGIKELYTNGAQHELGGGVLLGGLILLLHKLIGLTGCIIVIILMSIIGFIVVMDTSIIDMIKNINEDDYEDDYEDIPENRAIPNRMQNKDVLNSIRVLESEEKKSKKKAKNKIVESEEVHELKPIPNNDFFAIEDAKEYDFDTNTKEFKEDFFNKPDFSVKEEENVTVLEPVKRQRKKTKESQAEMVAERDAISKELEGVSANPTKTLSGARFIDESAPATAKSFSSMNERKTNTGASVADTLKQDVKKSAVSNENKENKEYIFPPIELLKTNKSKGANSEAGVRETAMKLKSTLESFGVNVTVTDYSCGPSVTRYELQPEQGVKVSKIVNLADDIKLNLAAADIRIEAPIPGKSAIGIEVPNKESAPVFFRDLLESDNFKKFPSKIAFAVGKDISGEVIVTDIAKMPHLLVAGATGSGKSVCINTLIMSILYKANPNDVKLIMVDPKQVELSVYNGIPHMLIPVVTDPKKAAGALNWAVMEMTNRYQLFAQYNVRNLQGYNEKVESVTGSPEGNEEMKKLPQIVIIVDELADLMMVAHGEVEDAIVRLSQLARAAGIHLIIATQRPSVDVITGLIKANVPSRIAMTVSSGVDSRTILDMNGAEKLLGKGDMLFYPTGYPKPVRVQGAFLSDDEIADVVDFIKEQSGDTVYDEKITSEIANSTMSGSGASGAASGGSDLDEYFVEAGKFIISKEKASIGMLQRVYKIGFNRAARIMDQLSEAGVVGPEEGTKPRKVLMSLEEFENYIEENL